ncbi:MAG: tRNA lysidine(34) synthetase TilS [Anaerolineae bacterium]|nr:tRNA lysidine(34) synthetase TilS [Anaerolineae bacterium]MDQ7036342.1 tRNA lysidine(34) synthetase TilS [Anaerolineae bacterium]
MILETVLDTHQQFKLFPPHTTIILAVSGGADSITLLHVMAQLRARLAIHLHVATLNHGLRDEAADDVAYVQEMANKLNIPVSTATVDVNYLSQNHNIGIEAAGRQARYTFFAHIAQQIEASVIATAHHADDQTETILMHLLRGSGVQGLVGMQAKSPLPDYPSLTLIRPLLRVRRADIEAYCDEHQLEPRRDATNDNTVFLRNKIRHSILPRLRQINPQIDRAFTQLGAIVAVEQDFMRTYYETTIQPLIQVDKAKSRFRVSRDSFDSWHPSMQRRFIKETSSQLGADAGYTHILAAIDTAKTGAVGSIAQLTKGVRLRIAYDDIVIEHESTPLPIADYWLIDREYAVSVSGISRCGTWVLEVTAKKQTNSIARLNIPPDSQVMLRTRQAGDRFQPLGMQGQSKKIKNEMIDRKIPQHLRDSIPLLLVNQKIAAIILPQRWIIAEPFSVQAESQYNFYFSISKLL